ncbi:hypothetical protein ACRAWD_26320 [Caulobacter segnis]
MIVDPLLGVLFHWLGVPGLRQLLCALSRREALVVKDDTAELDRGIFSWLLAPWLFASIRPTSWACWAQVPSNVVGPRL